MKSGVFFSFSFVSFTNTFVDTPHLLFASGGEDRSVQFSVWSRVHGLIRVGALEGHISSVRTISVTNMLTDNTSSSTLLFSAGGRDQMLCCLVSRTHV